jgi:hypothetical protein
LSPVLRLAGIPFQLQAPGSEPYLIDDSGKLRPANLAIWSRAVLPPKPKNPNDICGEGPLLSGATTLTLPLRATLSDTGGANWFARIGYLSNQESHIQVELIDAKGKAVPLPASADSWPAGLATRYLGPSERIVATSVRLTTTDPGTNVCVATIEIGLPQVNG